MDPLTGMPWPAKGSGKGLEKAARNFKGGLEKQGKFLSDDSLVTSASFEPESEVIFDPFEIERGVHTTGVTIMFDALINSFLLWERGTQTDVGYSGDIQAI
jgi:hypothetical protein